MDRTILSGVPGVREVVASPETDAALPATERSGTAPGNLPVRSVHLSVAGLEPFEYTAILLAYLLVPGLAAHQERSKTYRAICYWAVHEGLVWPNRRRTYVFEDQTRVATALNRIDRLTAQRRGAALMALPSLLKTFDDVTLAMPTRRAMAGIVAEFGREADPKNVEYRIWGPSLPVIHLAVAVYMLTLETPGGSLSLLAQADSAECLLSFAEDCEQRVQVAPTLQGASRQLIRFRRD